jgi:hypothetical protein
MNFKSAGTFDPSLIQYEIQGSNLWNWLNLRKSRGLEHQAVDDIVLRFQSIEGAHELMHYFDGLDCVDLFVMHLFPQTVKAIREFAGDRTIGKVVIAKLKAKSKVAEHIDEGIYCANHDRYHFVVTSNPGCYLHVNRELCQMLPGEIWWLDNKSPHGAFNNGDSDRIHVIVDLR